MYHAENVLKLCKITYMYIVTKSINHILCKVSDYIKRFFWIIKVFQKMQ